MSAPDLSADEKAEVARFGVHDESPGLPEVQVERAASLLGNARTEWAVAMTIAISGLQYYYPQRDRESCERFIATPPLWHDRRLYSEFTIVSRLVSETEWKVA